MGGCVNFTSFIARRYMQVDRGNRFFSWISPLSITGVAIGVAAMIVVWSVINGFENELRRRFLVANAHVMAYRFPVGIDDPGYWIERFQKDFGEHINGISPFVHYETMVRNESLMHSTLIRGTDPEKRKAVQDLSFAIEPKSSLAIVQKEIEDAAAGKPIPEVPAVIVGKGLLAVLGAKVGDEIQYVQPDVDGPGAMRPFKVVGKYDSGLKHYDNKLTLMSITTAQKFFRMRDRVTGLEMGLHKPYDSREIAKAMDDKYELSIREWKSFNRRLFDAMESERAVILLITFMVVGVAGFNILTTIFVAVSQKQRDISILRSLGATSGQVQATFVKQGIMIGVFGCLFGSLLAVAISMVLERYQFIDLPDLYLLAKLPMTYDWWVYLSVCLVSIVIAILAGYFPALLASRVNPVDGFRGNQGA